MDEQFTYFINSLDNLIFTGVTTAFFALFYVAIGIGVIKRMFVFGNTQTLSTANKIIMTAFISGVVMMIILPIRDAVTDELSVEVTNLPSIEVQEGADFDYSAIEGPLSGLENLADTVHAAMYAVIIGLAVISVGISALRIKFSLGNPEIIAESRKMIKITIISAVIMMSASMIFRYFIDFFNETVPNPILDSITEREDRGGSLGDWTQRPKPSRDKSYTQKINRAPEPGFIIYQGTTGPGNGGSFHTYPIRPTLGESYSFKKTHETRDGAIRHYRGISLARSLNENAMIWVFVNSGYKVTVTSNDGHFTIRAPRIDEDNGLEDLRVREPSDFQITDNTTRSALEEGEDYITLEEGENLPSPKNTFVAMAFSTTVGWNWDTRRAYEEYDLSRANYRYIGALKWEDDLSSGSYSINFVFSEDDEPQKSFQRINLLEDEDIDDPEQIPVPQNEQNYILIEDISEEIANTPFLYTGHALLDPDEPAPTITEPSHPFRDRPQVPNDITNDGWLTSDNLEDLKNAAARLSRFELRQRLSDEWRVNQ